MEKDAVGKQTGGFMQSRKKTRPYRVDTLLQRKDGRKPTDLISDEPNESNEPGKAAGDFEASLAGLAGDEFKKESGSKETERQSEAYFDLHGNVPVTVVESNRGQHKNLSDFIRDHVKEGAAEFAPGIPVTRKIESIPVVKKDAANEEWDVVASSHPARVRGDHVDLRLVDRKGRAHSWALGKDLPDPGKSTYAIQQPTHTGHYALRKDPFSIPEGYGATRPGAQVRPLFIDKAEIVEAGRKLIRFLRHKGQETEEFVLRRIGPDDRRPVWVLNNATKNRSTQEGRVLPDYKPKYKEIAPTQVDFTDGNQLMSAKLDGAHVLVHMLGKDKPMRVYSYRPTVRQTGLIDHTYKFPGFQSNDTPDSLKGTILRAELWGADRKGRAIPPQELGGILNSGVPEARKKLQDRRVQLRLAALQVQRHRGQDYSDKAYSDHLSVLREVSSKVPNLELPPMAATEQEKRKLFERIQKGQLKETKEGVVLQDLNQSAPPTRIKFKPLHDVYVRNVFKKPAGEARGHAGGFEYSWEPDGPIVGRVGTGFDHKTRSDMLQNPERYVGRVAKVESQDVYQNRTDPSQLGALRAPSFQGWHLDKTDPELMKESSARWRTAMRMGELGTKDVVRLRKAPRPGGGKLFDYMREVAGLEEGSRRIARSLGAKIREQPKLQPLASGSKRALPESTRASLTAAGGGRASYMGGPPKIEIAGRIAAKDAPAHVRARRALTERHELDELRLGIKGRRREVAKAIKKHKGIGPPRDLPYVRSYGWPGTGHEHPEVITREISNTRMLHPKAGFQRRLEKTKLKELLGRSKFSRNLPERAFTPKEVRGIRKSHQIFEDYGIQPGPGQHAEYAAIKKTAQKANSAKKPTREQIKKWKAADRRQCHQAYIDDIMEW